MGRLEEQTERREAKRLHLLCRCDASLSPAANLTHMGWRGSGEGLLALDGAELLPHWLPHWLPGCLAADWLHSLWSQHNASEKNMDKDPLFPPLGSGILLMSHHRSSHTICLWTLAAARIPAAGICP